MTEEYNAPISRWHDPNYRPYAPKAILEPASDIPAKATDWLIPGWLATSEEQALVGPTGCGKSLLICTLAARISNPENKNAWPPEPRLSQGGRVVIINKEDPSDSALIPRLMAANANLDNISILKKVKTFRGFAPVNLAEHLPDIEDALNDHVDVRLVVIDNITSLYTRDGAKKKTPLPAVMERLRELAVEKRFALLLVSHLKKSGRDKEPISNIAGPLGFITSPRLIMQVGHYGEDDSSTCVLTRSKTSYCSNHGGFLYSVDDIDVGKDGNSIPAGRLVWHGAIAGSARSLLAPSSSGDEAMGRDRKRGIARQFLTEFLSEGPKPKKDVVHAAAEQGISTATLERAAQSLAVIREKERNAGPSSGFVWSLPASE